MSQSRMEEVIHGGFADSNRTSSVISESNPSSQANSKVSSHTRNFPLLSDLVSTAAISPLTPESSVPVNLKTSAVPNSSLGPPADAVLSCTSATAICSQTNPSSPPQRNTSPPFLKTTSIEKRMPSSSTSRTDGTCALDTRPHERSTDISGTLDARTHKEGTDGANNLDTRPHERSSDITGTLDARTHKESSDGTNNLDTRPHERSTDITGTLDARTHKEGTDGANNLNTRPCNVSHSNHIEIVPVTIPSKTGVSVSPQLLHSSLPIKSTVALTTEINTDSSVASIQSGAVLDLSSTAPKDLSTQNFPKHGLSRVSNLPLLQLNNLSEKKTDCSFLLEGKSFISINVQDQLTNQNFPCSNANLNCNSATLQSDESINSAVSLDISAGLTTIDTTSLATIDSPHRLPPSFDPIFVSVKSNRVTAHATIIPPLANSVQETIVSVPNDLKSRTPSNSPLHGPLGSPTKNFTAQPLIRLSQKTSHTVNTTPLTSISELHSSHFSQPSHQSLVKSTSGNLSNSNYGPQDLKSPSTSPICQPISVHAASSTSFTSIDIKSQFSRNDSKSPCETSLENCSPLRHCDKSSSAISCVTPARSSCSESPARSPIPPSPCSPTLSSPVVSGAGCEVRGMLANPVSVSTDKETRHCIAALADASDGGRLTFFKEGKLVLELSHRGNSNIGGSGSEGENCCWVQVKSKTYWPPPSHSTNIGSAHRDNNAMDSFGLDSEMSRSRFWRRKQSSPRRALPLAVIDHRGAAPQKTCLEEGPNHKQQCNATINHPSLLDSFGHVKARSTRLSVAGRLSFILVVPKSARAFRRLHRAACRPVKRDPLYRYHPYASIPALTGQVKEEAGHHSHRKYLETRSMSNSNMELERIHKKHQLEKCTYRLADRLGMRIDHSLGMGQLLDRFLLTSPSPKSFVSPRKRILKQLEVDHDSQLKKRNSNCGNRSCNGTESGHTSGAKSSNKGGGSSGSGGSSGASPHSIDSILSSEKQNESYLKSLLRPLSASKQRSLYSGSGGGGHHHPPPCEPKTENIKQEHVLAESPPSYKRDLGQHSRGWSFHHDRRDGGGQRREADERRNGEDRRTDERRETDGRRDGDERRESNQRWEADYGGYRARSPCGVGHSQNSTMPQTSNTTHTPKNVHGDVPSYPPGYNTLPAHNLAALYPHLFDPNYLFLNGLNPLTASGIMSNPHNQMALAAAAAAAAAASISSISSYGLGSLQLSALAATQYSNLINSALNPVAFGPGLTPNLPAALTPALTPGSAHPPALPLPTLNPAALPPTLTPGASPAQLTHHAYTPIVTSTNSPGVCNNNSSLLYSNSSSVSNPPYPSSRTSPYPNHNTRSPCSPQSKSPYPHSRSPYSPHARSSYSPHTKTHSYRSKSPFRGPASSSSYSSSYQPKMHSQQQYHHPTQPLPSRQASMWKSSVAVPASPRKPSPLDPQSPQDLPLNLSKPRTN